MKRSILCAVCALIVLAVMLFVMFSFEGQAAPMMASATSTPASVESKVGEDVIWYDQSIGKAGATIEVETGPAEKVTFFLHCDAPSAFETITVTWKQKAVVGSYEYTTAGLTHIIDHFTTAQDYVTYTIYSAGLLYPIHVFTVQSATSTVTADLLKVQK